MAKIIENSVVITFSKIVKSDGQSKIDLPEDLVQTLEAICSEMLGDAGIVVEINTDDINED